jgi:2-dehydro-3-deoxyphosphooctonate aldolase (KDO 8-P synthase)
LGEGAGAARPWPPPPKFHKPMEKVQIADFWIGGGDLVMIAGPCVIESVATTLAIARTLREYARELTLPLIFKASYDKANRTALSSFRGPGLEAGLEILARVKGEVGLPVLSDVHQVSEVEPAARVLDVLQIPAFLCRQTDLLVTAAATGKVVNIKKGQFLAPWDLGPAVDKVFSTGNRQVLLTERGAMFGYNNLVVDFRSLPLLRSLGCPVVLDVTHSVQLPGGQGTCSGGQREYIPLLARAGVAAGVDALFLEVHPDPEHALCDGPNSLPLAEVLPLWRKLKALHQLVREQEGS